jgi:hypothetical protein
VGAAVDPEKRGAALAGFAADGPQDPAVDLHAITAVGEPLGPRDLDLPLPAEVHIGEPPLTRAVGSRHEDLRRRLGVARCEGHLPGAAGH